MNARILVKICVFCILILISFGCAKKQQNIEIETPAEKNAEKTPPKVKTEVDRGTFPFQGEKLEFTALHVQTRMSLATAWVSVGHEMISENNRRVIEITGAAKSSPLVSLIAKIDDKVSAYIDAKTWKSVYGFKHLNENKRERQFSVWFVPEEHKATVERVYQNQTTTRDFAVPGDAMDSIAWVYELRSANLTTGEQRSWRTYDGWTINSVTAVAVADEELWTELGFFDCQKIEIYRQRSDATEPMGALSGVYVTPEDVVSIQKYLLGTVWLTKDAKHTPVQFAVHTGLGDFNLQINKVTYE